MIYFGPVHVILHLRDPIADELLGCIQITMHCYLLKGIISAVSETKCQSLFLNVIFVAHCHVHGR